MTDLMTAKKTYKAGDTVKMTVNRSGSETTLDFTFGTQPKEETQQQDATTSATNNGSNYYYYGGNPFSR